MQQIKDINKGDILTFKADDNKYKALLCTRIDKDKSPHNFTFVPLTFESKVKPTINDILECNFWGIGNTKNDYFKYSDKELEKMWSIHPEIKPYYLGSYGLIVWRKDFLKFRENFEFIDNLNIVDNLNMYGRGSANASSWNFLKDFFNEKFKTILADRGQKTFKVKSIIRA